MKLVTTLSLIALSLLLAHTYAASPKELGNVKWLRNYDEAVVKSIEANKPILILFQEVPGCAGCVNYGQTTLTHPLIVDAIESSFIPLAIHNNKGGHDKDILIRFKEPAWNFQVIRFIDAKGKDIIPRKDRIWTPAETASRMIEALIAAKQTVPRYLRTVAWSDSMGDFQTAVFSMSCFWDGEAKLGGIHGVIATEAGWLDGHEVVRLSYDNKTITWPELVELAQAQGCARKVYAPDTATLAQTPQGARAQLYIKENYRAARESDQKRHLQFSKLKTLELNLVQRTKINAALSSKNNTILLQWLSPSQLNFLSTSNKQHI